MNLIKKVWAMFKICTKCSEKKYITEFHKRKAGKLKIVSRCKQCYSSYYKKYYQNNRRKKINQVKNSYDKDKKLSYDRKRHHMLKHNPDYTLPKNIRGRVRKVIKGLIKSGSAVKDLGCSIEFLKQYLESQFQPNMTWKNYGYCGWHIDHIKPLASFDLTNRQQFLEACHYSNLQPLWAYDNLSKGSKIRSFM